MLTLQDCIAFSGLTAEQLRLVADHEHLAEIVAAEWVEMVLERDDGAAEVERILADEFAHLATRGRADAAKHCRGCLDEFRRSHPH